MDHRNKTCIKGNIPFFWEGGVKNNLKYTCSWRASFQKKRGARSEGGKIFPLHLPMVENRDEIPKKRCFLPLYTYLLSERKQVQFWLIYMRLIWALERKRGGLGGLEVLGNRRFQATACPEPQETSVCSGFVIGFYSSKNTNKTIKSIQNCFGFHAMSSPF